MRKLCCRGGNVLEIQRPVSLPEVAGFGRIIPLITMHLVVILRFVFWIKRTFFIYIYLYSYRRWFQLHCVVRVSTPASSHREVLLTLPQWSFNDSALFFFFFFVETRLAVLKSQHNKQWKYINKPALSLSMKRTDNAAIHVSSQAVRFLADLCLACSQPSCSLD